MRSGGLLCEGLGEYSPLEGNDCGCSDSIFEWFDLLCAIKMQICSKILWYQHEGFVGEARVVDVAAAAAAAARNSAVEAPPHKIARSPAPVVRSAGIEESMASTALGAHMKNIQQDSQPTPLFPDNSRTEYFDAADFTNSEDARTEYFDAPVASSIQKNATTHHVEPTGVPVELTSAVHFELPDVIEDAKPMVVKAMVEHFELAQGPRRSLPDAELDNHGRVIKLRCAHADCVPKFMRLSSETFPDLEGPQLQLLSDVCLAAHYSEKFYLSVATNQWVRTSITCEKSPEEFFSEAEERPRLISYGMTIHSNVLPLDPFWTKAQAGRNDASKRAHFPCSVLQEAVKGGNTLMKQVDEWREKREECELIGQHGLKRSVDGITREDPCRLFWEIRADVKPLKELARGSDGIVWLVLWRGGLFVRKDRKRASDNDNNSDPRDAVDTELSIVEKLSHPHIVFSFGVS